jgi:exopolysaccharide biosynthesis polyprenyl glycosylphosphotransferase
MTADVRESTAPALPSQGPAHTSVRDPLQMVPSLPVRRVLPWQRRHIAALLVTDALGVMAAGAAVIAARFTDEPALVQGHTPYWLLLPIAALAWLVIAAFSGAYELRVVGSGSEEYKRVLNTAVRYTAFVAITSYALQAEVARTVVLWALPATGIALLLTRHAVRVGLGVARKRGHAVRRVLVIGNQQPAFDMAARLTRDTAGAFRVVGVCAPGGTDRRSRRASAVPEERRQRRPVPVLGSLGEAPLIARGDGVDVIAVAHSPGMTSGVLRSLAWQLEGTNVEMMVAPALVDVAGPRIHVSPVAGLPLLHVDKPEFSLARRLLKGSYDRLLGLLGLVALSPLLLAVALSVRLDSPGPVLFRQTRVGKGGENFTMLKFRSMHVDADARVTDLTAENIHGDGPLFKMRDDPRLTRVGRFIRRWSLDELPQLWNVVRGDMSLVGPRPPLPREVAEYDGPAVYRRLMVKPGLTGLWQVSGRADLPWQEAVRLDLYYVENWSPALDVSILWRTAAAVARGRGAY